MMSQGSQQGGGEHQQGSKRWILEEAKVFTHQIPRYTSSVSPGSNKQPKKRKKEKCCGEEEELAFERKGGGPFVFWLQIPGTRNEPCFGWKRFVLGN